MLEGPWRRRGVLLAQLAATLAVLGSPLGNTPKLLVLLGLWVVTFWPIRPTEAGLFFAACFTFTALNALALQRGIFRFENPDWLGMPAFELGMWGFYHLHTLRMFEGRTPGPPSWAVGVLAVVYAALFALIADPMLLFAASAAVLTLALSVHHRPLDLGYVAYMTALGLLVEHVGTGTGQWSYPGQSPGGIPLWSVTLWGGVGFFVGRLVAPLAAWLGRRSASSPRPAIAA